MKTWLRSWKGTIEKSFLISTAAFPVLLLCACSMSAQQKTESEIMINMSDYKWGRNQKKLEELSYLNKEYLLKNTGLTEADMEGVDVDRFCKNYACEELGFSKMDPETAFREYRDTVKNLGLLEYEYGYPFSIPLSVPDEDMMDDPEIVFLNYNEGFSGNQLDAPGYLFDFKENRVIECGTYEQVRETADGDREALAELLKDTGLLSLRKEMIIDPPVDAAQRGEDEETTVLEMIIIAKDGRAAHVYYDTMNLPEEVKVTAQALEAFQNLAKRTDR